MSTPKGEPIYAASLFTFYNAFDDVYVGLDDRCAKVPQDGSGPYEVKLTHGDRAIGTEADNITEQFDTLKAAYERFSELVKNEVGAVLDDGSLK
jgi:hypothetical protein